MTATYYDEEDGLENDITMDSREAAEYAPQIITGHSFVIWFTDIPPVS